MHHALSILLLPALLPAAQAQDNEAEKLFRTMDKKVQAANAVQVTFEIELRAIKGREEDSKLKDKVSRANGFLLWTKDNKVRLKISGEYVGMELVSNGQKLKLATDEGEARTIDQAKAMPTPNHLHSLVGTVMSRAGVTAGSMIITFAPGPQFTPIFLASGEGAKKDFDPDSFKMSVWDFKAGAPEKVGGRDAKVVSYKLGPKDDKDSTPVTLWIDAKTLLPLKCIVVITKENMHINELYTEFKLDPRIDAKAFELVPAQGNEAEKLFRAMEERIKAARAVQFTFEAEMKGRGKGEEAKLKGSVLFTKDNKARLKMSGNEMGKEMTIEMISDGKRMKMAESPETIAKADEERTRTDLHSLLSAAVSGPGLLLTYGDFSPGPPAPTYRLVNFKAGAAEKVGGREAKVVTCDAVLLGDTCQVTLWIDAETLLPLKRLIVYAGNHGKPGRITEICNFDLNPKVDAGAFALPK
jgi:outer membrane lipoprotein-sorting protein